MESIDILSLKSAARTKIDSAVSGMSLDAFAIEIPDPTCQNSFLPTKGELVNVFSQIAGLPSKIQIQLAVLTANANSFSLDDEIEKLKKEVSKEAQDVKNELIAEAEKAKQQILQQYNDIKEQVLEAVKKIKEYIKKIEEFVDKFTLSLSNPVFGSIVIPEQEWERRITALVQEYQLKVMTFILDIIAEVLPVEFEITVFPGFSVDILQLCTDAGYRAEKKAEIKREVKRFREYIDEEYKSFMAKYGTSSEDFQVEMVWSWMMNKLKNFAFDTLYELCDKLTNTEPFKTVWETFSFTGVPTIQDFPAYVKQQLQAQLTEWKADYEQAKLDIQAKIEEIKQANVASQIETQMKEWQTDLKERYASLEAKLHLIQVGGYDLKAMLGQEITDAIHSAERRIDRYTAQLNDFSEDYMKKLLLDWINEVMSFLEDIGLGAIADWSTYTFCDFCTDVGLLPISIDVGLPIKMV
jgi:hypothetical protein